MKKYSAILFLALIFFGCGYPVTYKRYTPIYMSFAELRSSVKLNASKDLKNPGKIYVKGNYLYINEKNKGMHIIDNSTPSAPVKKGFISIPGNFDISIKGDTLYADSYTDLVAIELSSDLSGISVTKRLENVFTYDPYISLGLNRWNYYYYNEIWEPIDSTKGVVVGWDVKEETRYEYPSIFPRADYSGSGSSESTGVGGSTARFTIIGDCLYTVDSSYLYLFKIQDSGAPSVWLKEYVGWNIETIFPFDGNLLIGSTSAMYVYDVSTDALNPIKMSSITHFTSCDPVVAERDYAYVTLRSGNTCGNSDINELQIIDISNLTQPKLKARQSMYSPSGLGVKNGILFICDGKAGVKIFDVRDTPTNPKFLKQIDIETANDVIPYNNILIITTDIGVAQYDYSDLSSDIKKLSEIPIVEKGYFD
ncbi:MAG TPA: hypothetical protein PK385_03865 [Spirochaetota bacterium]|nr:hypothetical protein [Spirochaetota bacterium]HOS55174.1 hypothetical protein [Spirochaetota bacterium]HPK62799.1 hypothetical protein [Spirochaetota bacterium]HQF76997.1 hypothetical protein [Spirochaetota bacterium]HQH30911.1 hypothetical protein [Spirochaetota bacterium]